MEISPFSHKVNPSESQPISSNLKLEGELLLGVRDSRWLAVKPLCQPQHQPYGHKDPAKDLRCPPALSHLSETLHTRICGMKKGATA